MSFVPYVYTYMYAWRSNSKKRQRTKKKQDIKGNTHVKPALKIAEAGKWVRRIIHANAWVFTCITSIYFH